MTVQKLETDYLVVGAGAMGMAFADEVLSGSSTDRVILVDKHAKAGGHWNDAYPFVSLHQPAAFYGVNSEKLGSGGAALASGVEVLSYYERVLCKLLGSGRLQHFSMCDYRGDGCFRSIVAPEKSYEVAVRKKTVDATYMAVQVPSMTPPRYEIAPEITVVPPNDLPQVRQPQSGYVIIGAGKTGIDAALFLLEQGVAPDQITWIMSNDAWLLDRALIQPGKLTGDGFGAQLESFAGSSSLKELFTSLEANKRILRLDERVWPTKYRCATVSLEELEQLRRIENVVRMGRVVRIEPTAIVLENGSLPTDRDHLHVDCTADGLAKREIRPVFEGTTITLQSLFMCQQVFSAAVIGHVESRYDDEAMKNELCQVVPHPERDRDYVAAMLVSLDNMAKWGGSFGRWLRKSRLCFAHHESTFKLIRSGIRARRLGPLATGKMRLILEQEFQNESGGSEARASG